MGRSVRGCVDRLRMAAVDPRALRRLRRSGLFDAPWYLRQNPDVRSARSPALRHYLALGWRQGRDPNPCFSLVWYARTAHSGARRREPLSHYIQVGEGRGLSPSPHFDPLYYERRYPDVRAAGLAPLSHFLQWGRQEGRSGRAALSVGPDVSDADLRVAKAPVPPRDGRLAILVCQTPEGRLRPHVPSYVRFLRDSGFQVVLAVVADGPVEIEPALAEALAGLYLRWPGDGVFSVWAQLFRAEPGFLSADALLLLDDSLVPRVDRLGATLDGMMRSDAGLVGLTGDCEMGRRYGSEFMLVRSAVLGSCAFQRFMLGVREVAAGAATRACEIDLAAALCGAGLRCEAVFPSSEVSGDEAGRWEAVLQRGFPAVGVSLLAAGAATRERLLSAGIDGALVARMLRPAPPAPHSSPPLANPLRGDGRRRITYLGDWGRPGAEGEQARACVSALWRSGALVNLRPLAAPTGPAATGAATLPVFDFEGPADLALIDLDALAGGDLDEGARQVLDRARRRVGLCSGRRSPLPGLDLVLAPDGYVQELARGRPEPARRVSGGDVIAA